MPEPIEVTPEEQYEALLEPLLGIHTAPNEGWLADATASAAERGLGALYSVLYVIDGQGRLRPVPPASVAHKSALVRLSQALGANILESKIDPESRGDFASALSEAKAAELQDVNDALPDPLSEERLASAQLELGVRSAVLAPIHWDGETSGLLVLYVGSASAANIRHAELLGSHVAVALANLREREASRRRGEVDAVRWVYDERRFLDELGQESRRAKRHDRPLSVLTVRILNLGELQSRFGRFLGERVLRQVAGRLDDAMRDTDFLGALASDGFGAILIEADGEGAKVAEQRLLAGLQDMKLPHSDLPKLDLHIGCATATMPQDGETPEDLIAAAEARMEERLFTQKAA